MRYWVPILLLAIVVSLGTSAFAAGVVSTCDEASLNTALAGGGAVTFTCSGTITVTTTKTIAINTTIDGTGENVIISGGNSVRIFVVDPGITLNLIRIVFQEGFANNLNGGAISTGIGSVLSIDTCVFALNAASGATASGGAIYAKGSVTIVDSVFAENSAELSGGAIGGDGAAAQIDISRSSFLENSGSFGGVVGVHTLAFIEIQNSTFSENIGVNAGTIYLEGSSNARINFSTFFANVAVVADILPNFGTTIELKNSIFSQSTPAICSTSFGGNYLAEGSNFDTDGSCAAIDPEFTQVTPAQLNLGPLQSNGEIPFSHALGPGSVALDAATDCTDFSAAAVLADQRGISRPQPIAGQCDVGAYEAVQEADLLLAKTNNTSGVVDVPNPFNWTLSLNNNGFVDATFSDGEVILRDNLPNGLVSYDQPDILNNVNITGLENMFCLISDALLECSASGGAVSIGSGGSLDVIFEVTPMGLGSVTNPTNGVCTIDPNNIVVELSETNNDCDSDTIDLFGPIGTVGNPETFNLSTSFNIPFWCGERKNVFTMDGKEFTNIEQFDTEIEIVLPQRRILLIFNDPDQVPISNFIQTATITEPSNFEAPGAMTVPFRSLIRVGKTIREGCNDIKAFPATEDSNGFIEQLLGNLLSGVDYFHGVVRLEADTRDLRIFSTKIVRSWKCVDQGSGLDCFKGRQTRERNEIGNQTIRIRRTVAHELPFGPIVSAAMPVENPKFEARTLGTGRALEFRAQSAQSIQIGVEIFALTGRKIYADKISGNSLVWNMRDQRGRAVANGIYLYVVTARDVSGNVVRSEVKKLMVLR